MMDLARQTFTFCRAGEALSQMMQPGRVPDVLISATRMQDESIRGFMRRFEALPRWVTDKVKVFVLAPPLSMFNDGEPYHHRLIQRTMHKPFCVYELMEGIKSRSPLYEYS
ncbi:MAG: hypothetical protein AB1458_15030 [Bacteroidota bacterium]